MLKIAILASGSGSNAESLVRYFEQSDVARVNLIVTNNPKAGVIERAKRLNVVVQVFSPSTERQGDFNYFERTGRPGVVGWLFADDTQGMDTSV
jgi:folate-dependent phosphoribosylglycinamide formyltransferase PurN